MEFAFFFSKYHIDVSFNSNMSGLCRFTGFYGEPLAHPRQGGWNMLRELNNSSSLPWMIMGDCNEVLCSSEQKGGMGRSQSQIKAF